MTNEEFSNAFDILLNSYSNDSLFGELSSRADIVLNEYEKSFFLTLALLLLIINLYNGKATSEGFEKTEELRLYINNLVVEKIFTNFTESLDSLKSYRVTPDFKILFKVFEQAEFKGEDPCLKDKKVMVVPVTHDEYSVLKDNPFRTTNSRKILRLDVGNDIELISKYPLSKYILRYIKYPNPIILENLPQDTKIDGQNSKTECELNSELHPMILDLAVSMAIKSRVGKSKE